MDKLIMGKGHCIASTSLKRVSPNWNKMSPLRRQGARAPWILSVFWIPACAGMTVLRVWQNAKKGEEGFRSHNLASVGIVAAMIFALTIASPTPTLCTDSEGPPKPSCDAFSGATKVKLPLVRTFLLDVGMITGMMILWPEAYLPTEGSVRQFKKGWTKPPYMNPNKPFFELDDDPWFINGVLHGIYGSEVYLAGRTYGHSGFVSFMYAVFASVTWEYLIEAWYQRPSGIDLVWTPFAGAVIGELRFQLIRLILRNVSSPRARRVWVAVLDPVGQLERAFMGCRIGCSEY